MRRPDRFRDEFECPSCGATLTKRGVDKRTVTVRTPLGDRVERMELRPAAVAYRDGKNKQLKQFDDADARVLARCSSLPGMGAPNVEVPYLHMTHERSTIYSDGFRRVHHFYSDRALVTLGTLWTWAGEYDDKRLILCAALLDRAGAAGDSRG